MRWTSALARKRRAARVRRSLAGIWPHLLDDATVAVVERTATWPVPALVWLRQVNRLNLQRPMPALLLALCEAGVTPATARSYEWVFASRSFLWQPDPKTRRAAIRVAQLQAERFRWDEPNLRSFAQCVTLGMTPLDLADLCSRSAHVNAELLMSTFAQVPPDRWNYRHVKQLADAGYPLTEAADWGDPASKAARQDLVALLTHCGEHAAVAYASGMPLAELLTHRVDADFVSELRFLAALTNPLVVKTLFDAEPVPTS